MRGNIIKKVMVPAGFLAVVIIAVVVYVGLHRNKEALAPLDYSGIKGINLENVPPNYWNTDAIHKIAAAENGYYYITDEDMLVYFDMDNKDEVPVHIIQQAVTHVLMAALYTTFIIIMAACIICR